MLNRFTVLTDRNSSPFSFCDRLQPLIDSSLSLENLQACLDDLPWQLENLQPRPWQPIDWQTIDSHQIVGIETSVFLAIIAGAAATEAPIRGYTQTSRQYLDKIHPHMARLVGGTITDTGTMLELGLWEKEERRHGPALIKIHLQLTGQKFPLHPRSVKPYQPSQNPYADLYYHGLHRIITEYSAVCLYLWLMVHTTGSLQQVFSELLRDEINHMVKFWGFGVWLFGSSTSSFVKRLTAEGGHPQAPAFQAGERVTSLSFIGPLRHFRYLARLKRTFGRMMGTLNWNAWSWVNQLELTYIFVCVIYRLWCWNCTLTSDYLQQILGYPPLPPKGNLIADTLVSPLDVK